ncbi:MAG: hypothetical protein GXX94_00455 [Chloroflexi bacterium]|nr:hypothetical protein [Chloroflexota bacterium]
MNRWHRAISVSVVIGVLVFALSGCGGAPAQEGAPESATVGASAETAAQKTATPAEESVEGEDPTEPTAPPEGAADEEAEESEGETDLVGTDQDDAGSGGDAGAFREDALPIDLAEVYEGLLDGDDTADWYSLTVPASSVVRVTLSAGRESDGLEFSLRNADLETLGYSPYVAPGTEEDFSSVLSAESDEQLYLEVLGSGPYTLEASAEAQDDAGSGADAGGDSDEAVALGMEESFRGALGGEDVADWYVLDVPDGSAISLSFTPDADADDHSITLYDPDRYDVWSEWSVPGKVTRELRYAVDADRGGTYYLAIDGGAGTYAVELSIAAQDDADSGADAPYDVDDALSIDAGEEYSGEIGGSDPGDSYRFAAAEGMVVSVTAGDDVEDLLVALYDSEGSEIWYDYVSEDTISYTLEEVLDGDYVVQVADATGTYTLMIEE